MSPFLHFNIYFVSKTIKSERDIKYADPKFAVSKFTFKLLENFKMSIFIRNSIYLLIFPLKIIMVIKYKDLN